MFCINTISLHSDLLSIPVSTTFSSNLLWRDGSKFNKAVNKDLVYSTTSPARTARERERRTKSTKSYVRIQLAPSCLVKSSAAAPSWYATVGLKYLPNTQQQTASGINLLRLIFPRCALTSLPSNKTSSDRKNMLNYCLNARIISPFVRVSPFVK